MAIDDPLSSLDAKYDEAIALGWATQADKDDGMAQEQWVEANYASLEGSYPGKWVAVAADTPFPADTPIEAEEAASAAFPDRQYVVLPIPPAAMELGVLVSGS